MIRDAGARTGDSSGPVEIALPVRRRTTTDLGDRHHGGLAPAFEGLKAPQQMWRPGLAATTPEVIRMFGIDVVTARRTARAERVAGGLDSALVQVYPDGP